MKFRLIRSVPVTADITSFVFEPEEAVKCVPGQYFHYTLPHKGADDRGDERWFTNSAAPSEGRVMISTRIAANRGSSFKHALQQLQPGDEIEADGPEGDFTVEDISRNYLFVAGGIGITPFRSILVEASKEGKQLNATLLYANRTSEIPFSEELDQIATTMPTLKIKYITQPDRIDNDLLKLHIKTVKNPIVYVSGPEPMVKSFAEQLAQLGLKEENIKTDDFPGYEAD
jgi:ferredoxin-NADP reductase